MRKVTPSQYVEMLNNALKGEGNFKDGMRFALHPEGSTDTTALGISFEGPPEAFLLAAHVQAQVSQSVRFV